LDGSGRQSRGSSPPMGLLVIILVVLAIIALLVYIFRGRR
jgi:hypothetical protein